MGTVLYGDKENYSCYETCSVRVGWGDGLLSVQGALQLKLDFIPLVQICQRKSFSLCLVCFLFFILLLLLLLLLLPELVVEQTKVQCQGMGDWTRVRATFFSPPGHEITILQNFCKPSPITLICPSDITFTT